MTIWLALLAVLPAWAVLNVPFAVNLRSLPRSTQLVLALAIGAPMLAALFSPQPITAIIAGLAHTLMVLGLLGLGTKYPKETDFWPVAWGLLVTIIIAAFYTLGIHEHRLTHPVWAATSIGLGGALLSILAIYLSTSGWLRVLLIVTGGAALLWSGSRGALLALLVALPFSSLRRRTRHRILMGCLSLSVFIGGLIVGGRWLTIADGGRELLWSNAQTIIKENIIGGMGRWHLGTYIWPEKKCLWWQELEIRGIRCQDYLDTAQPQVIAHNAVLQTLGEVGIVGASGEFLMFGIALTLAWKAKRPVAFGALLATLVMGLTDTPLFLPGPFGGVLAYVMIGSVLTSAPIDERALLWGCATGILVFGLTLVPPLMNSARPDKRPIQAQILSVGLDRSGRYHDIRFDFVAPPGNYQVDLLACKKTCSQLRTISVKGGQKNVLMQVGPPSFPTKLVLRVLNQRGLKPRELSQWAVPRFGEFLPTH